MEKGDREIYEFVVSRLEGCSKPAAEIVDMLLPSIKKNPVWQDRVLRRGVAWLVTMAGSVGRLSHHSLVSISDVTRRRVEEIPLTNWRLETGKLLGLATRDDLIKSAEALEASAKGSLARAILYRRLAAKLKKDTDTVETAFGDADVVGALIECEEAAAAAVEEATSV